MTNTNVQFSDFPLDKEILKALDLLGYKKPAKVQEELIPLILRGKDCIVKSKTGSGKTAAFAIPLCQLIDWDENKPQALVLTPTRELAVQVQEEIFNIGRLKRIKVASVFGKSSFRHQEKELKQKTHVVVGTPGRIIDHLDRETLDVSMIKYLVIDEADEMLDMGFIEQIEDIISFLPDNRINILLSATVSEEVRELCDAYLNNPEYVETEEKAGNIGIIKQVYYKTDEDDDKNDVLLKILIKENPDTGIIFCGMRAKVEDVYAFLKKEGIPCGKIHGDLEQDDRLKVMRNFKKGKFPFLVATDVAARGIDVDNISLVINYDFPRDKESYVHRIGRTGRIGKDGKAVSILTSGDQKYFKQVQKIFTEELQEESIPTIEEVEGLKTGFLEKASRKPEVKESKDKNLVKNIMKIHINAGKKTKMRPVDVVGTLCNIEGITAEDIGVINILDVSTFVEILNGKGEHVLKVLQTKPVKGRIRKVKEEKEEEGR